MNRNRTFLNSFTDVSDHTFDKLQKISIFKEIEAHTTITRAGEIPTKVYMLTTGFMRAYLSLECGKERNKNIFSPYSFAGALTALIKEKPSELTYETLTYCKGYEINFEALRELCKTDLIISNLYNKILESIFIAYEKRQLDLISLDASQRYLKLKKQIPDIDDIIPQFQIASYLNITPVQLSRIRKKIKLIVAY
jgi:CRP-like cAMP-binding protein